MKQHIRAYLESIQCTRPTEVTTVDRRPPQINDRQRFVVYRIRNSGEEYTDEGFIQRDGVYSENLMKRQLQKSLFGHGSRPTDEYVFFGVHAIELSGLEHVQIWAALNRTINVHHIELFCVLPDGPKKWETTRNDPRFTKRVQDLIQSGDVQRFYREDLSIDVLDGARQHDVEIQ